MSGLLTRLQRAWGMLRADSSGLATYGPADDYWYTNYSRQTAAGIRVSPDTALSISAVFACVRVVSETIASLPLIIYRRLPDGGKERATDHPLYKPLHDRPNQWQTAFEFWEMMQGHLELRGNAFAFIQPATTQERYALVPIHPDRVRVQRYPNSRLRYEVMSYGAATEVYSQEDIFHLRGMSSDGICGMSTIYANAETFGTAKAQQDYVGRFFDNDATPGGVFLHPKTLTAESHDRLKKSINESQSGANRHKTMVLEEGMSYTKVGLTNRESQMIEARQFSRSDIASAFRVPLHKIGDLTRATFSNIEQQAIEFATDSIRPRAVRIERRVNNDLVDPLDIGDGFEYFAEFLMDALLRGDQKSRYESYAIGIQNTFLSPNECRAFENLNPYEGGDKYYVPLNTIEAGSKQLSTPEQLAPREDSTATGAKQLPEPVQATALQRAQYLLKESVEASAERVVRKEVKALRRIVERADSNPVKARTELAIFYESHVDFVMEAMHIRPAAAEEYVNDSRRALAADISECGVSRLEVEAAGRLTNIVLREKQCQMDGSMPIVTVNHTTQFNPVINMPKPDPPAPAPHVNVRRRISREGSDFVIDETPIESPIN